MNTGRNINKEKQALPQFKKHMTNANKASEYEQTPVARCLIHPSVKRNQVQSETRSLQTKSSSGVLYKKHVSMRLPSGTLKGLPRCSPYATPSWATSSSSARYLLVCQAPACWQEPPWAPPQSPSCPEGRHGSNTVWVTDRQVKWQKQNTI